ncbi:conjugal transfer protein TraG N-terminal domain-containing protein [Halomonas sp. KO116]|uniref:conjugal transfer protein TraG N-terminal domain-containing protein n=1 Tax=Halomonas sp. KO116 TaxID=1504981 RepID=UPI0004E32105|nr:conjugal transfer protein TraG N-terminal domain-containing protein [Halomonas sp. KO116]AJY53233.1 TraG domain-containing protein [Halomonas sp. KO116]
MFTIYSIGDSAFLEQILIAIAMVTNTGDFTKMVSSGLLLGVLIMAFQSLFRGGQTIPFQQILVCWILYACGFGPTATVIIEDAYTGDARVVSQVPLGVAGAGSIISTVGYSITSLFETGYGVISPSVTSNHFADSLKLLNDVRKGVADPAVFSAINGQIGGDADLRRSLHTYITECTLVKLDRNLISAEEMFTNHTMSALRFDSEIFGTRVYDGPVGGTHVNCSEGFDRIQDMLSTIGMPDSQDAISAVMRDHDIYTDIFSKLDGAMHALGLGMSDAQNYVQLSLIEPVYHEAAAGKYRDFRDFTSSMMVNQAIQQRNTQWSAESSMFMSIVRPMLAFIEGFVYAITPFMAFLVVLGGFGIQLAVKYGQMLLWTQLWMPVLAIINLFLHMAASREMASYSMDTGGISTFYALSRSSDILENWIATGGMLAAATPILTLVLVTGSSYAMTSLAGRMQGGDHINEKMSNPDAATNDAVLKNMPKQTQDPTQGQRNTGAEKAVGTFAIGSTVGSAVSSAESHMASATQNFTKQLGSSIQETAGTNSGQALSNGIAASVQSTGSESSEAVMGASQRLSRDLGYTGSEGNQVANQIAAAATANVGFSTKLGGAGASTSVGTTNTDSNQFSISDSQLQSYMSDNGVSEKQMAQLSRSVAQDLTRSDRQEDVHSLGLSNKEDLLESASEATQASQTFSSIDSLSSSYGANDSYDWATLSQNLVKPSTDGQTAAAKQLQQEAAFLNSGEVNERTDVLQEHHGFGEAQAQAMARLEVMTNRGSYGSEQEYLSGMSKALNIAGGAMGRDFTGQEAPNPMEHSSLSERTPDLDSTPVTDEVRGGVTPPTAPSGSMTDLRNNANRGITPEDEYSAVNFSGSTPAAVSSAHAQNTSAVEETDRNNVQEVSGKSFEAAETQLSRSAENARTDSSTMENVVASLGGNGSAQSMGVNERHADHHIASMGAEERAELIAKIDNGSETMGNYLSNLNSLGHRGAKDADPAVAEAILRTEDGDYSSVGNVDPQTLMQIGQQRDIRQEAESIGSSVGGLFSAAKDFISGDSGSGEQPSPTERAHNEQLFAARFDANQNLGLSEGETGIVAAMGTGSAQEGYLNHYTDKLVQEQTALLEKQGIDDPERAQQNAENIKANLIDSVISTGSATPALSAISQMRDSAEGASTGQRDIPAHEGLAQDVDTSTLPKQSPDYGPLNVQSNPDAPPSSPSSSDYTPIELPPSTGNQTMGGNSGESGGGFTNFLVSSAGASELAEDAPRVPFNEQQMQSGQPSPGPAAMASEAPAPTQGGQGFTDTVLSSPEPLTQSDTQSMQYVLGDDQSFMNAVSSEPSYTPLSNELGNGQPQDPDFQQNTWSEYGNDPVAQEPQNMPQRQTNNQSTQSSSEEIKPKERRAPPKPE